LILFGKKYYSLSLKIFIFDVNNVFFIFDYDFVSVGGYYSKNSFGLVSCSNSLSKTEIVDAVFS